MSEVKTNLKLQDGRMFVVRTQDVEPIVEANKRAFDYDDRRFKSESFNHVARIPLVVIEKWCNDNGVKYQEFMNDENILRKFLNDPDHKFLRTKPGKV